MKIPIDDLPPEDYYINTEGNIDRINKLLDEDSRSIKEICERDNKFYKRIASKKRGGDMTISDFKRICRRLDISFDSLDIKYIKRRNSDELPVSFPIKARYSFGRLLGHLSGDGSLHKGGRSKFRFNYTNQKKRLINSIKECVFDLFGKCNYYIEEPTEKKDAYTIIFPTVLGHFIYDLVGEDFRTNTQRIPFKCLDNKEAKKGFLQSIFSDDGTVSPAAKQVQIRLSNKELLKDLRNLLDEFNIKSSEVKSMENGFGRSAYYGIEVSGRFMRRFNRKVGFVPDTEKDKKLQKIEDSYVKDRSNVMGETREKILNMLSEGDMSTEEIIERLEYTKNYVRIRLRELEKEGKVIKVSKRKPKRDEEGGFIGSTYAKWGVKNA